MHWSDITVDNMYDWNIDFQVQMKTTRAIQRPAPKTSNIDPELAKKFASRNKPELDTIRERSASVDVQSQDNELTSKLNKQLNKQASLDSGTHPVPKPRGGSIGSKPGKIPPPVASKPAAPKAEPSNELTAKLNARLKKNGENEGEENPNGAPQS